MAQHANQDVGRTALGRAQEYLELGYKVIAIAGEIGSGKSTLGNLYCGWTGNAPFSVEDGTDEGTLETTGYADDVNRIYWLDTRGVGHLFDHTQWMAMLETLVVHGLILVSYPLPRSNPQLQEFSKNTFQVFDVPNLMARVKELRQALNSAERNNERLQQINHNLRRDNEDLRAELQEKQRKLEESTVSFDRLNKCFSELQAASWTFTETILRPPRSRDANRRTNTNDEQHRFQRQDVSHLFSLFCILSGPIGAALLHEQLTSYRRDVRQGARALRVALFEVCPTLSRPSYSRGGRLTEVSNGNTTVESRSTVGSRSGLSTSFMEYLNDNAVAVVVAAAAAAAAAAASNPSTPPLSLYSSAQTSPNNSNTQLHTIIDSPSEVSHSSEDDPSSGSEDAPWRASNDDEPPPPPRYSMVQGPASTAFDHDASLLRTTAASVTPMMSTSMSTSASALSSSIPILNSLVLGPAALPSAST